MPFNRYENVSQGNPMPVQEAEGTYNAKEHISATNPLPVMAVEDGAYSNYESVSEANPQPVAIIADSGTFTRHEDYSDTNAFPVKFIEGQSYNPRFDVSETNPWPVVVVSGGGEEYEGPLDIDAAGIIAAYSLRALSAENRGEPLYTLREDSGDTEQEFESDAVTGASPSAAITTFLNGANGSGTVWEDKSGSNRDLSQPISASQPVWLPNEVNGSPAFTGTKTWTNVFPNVALNNGGFTIFLVVKGDAEVDIYNGAFTHVELTTGTAAAVYAEDDAAHGIGCDGANALAWDDYVIVEAAFEYGSRRLLVNGVSIAGEVYDDTFGAVGPLDDIIVTGMDIALTQGVVEFLFYEGMKSEPTCAAIRQNMAAAYGVTL